MAPREAGYELVLTEPGPAPGPSDQVPGTVQEVTRELVRSEQVQLAVRRGLIDVLAIAAEEEQAAGGLAGFDPAQSQAAIHEVKLAYLAAARAVLTPAAVTKANHAMALHAGLRRQTARSRLQHFQGRYSPHREADDAVSRMNTWAWQLEERLTKLDGDANGLKAAEAARAPDVASRRHRLARDAELIMTSIEALGEWDLTVQVHDALRGNSSLAGFDRVDDLNHRMGQMHDAASDGDLEYLTLLLRDHRADPDVRAFYESIASTIQWSKLVLSLAITFIAIVAAAPIGIVAGGLAGTGAVALGAAEGGVVAVSATFLAHTGAEALAFTLVTRQLSAGVPGMAPAGEFWHEFLWNWGLFMVLRGASTAITASLAQSSKLAVTAAQLSTSYVVLQQYGMLRFAVEEGRAMSSDEVLTMAVQNLIILGALSVATMPFGGAFARLEHRQTLGRLRMHFGRRFAKLDGEVRDLESRASARIEQQPEATKEQLADLEAEAVVLNERLTSLVEEVTAHPDIDVQRLRTETADLFGDVARLSLPDFLHQSGLSRAVQIRPTGSEATWTVSPGRAGELVEFLGGQGVPVEVREVGGRTVIETTIPARGLVVFTEGRRVVVRPGESARSPETAPRKASTPPRRGKEARTESQTAVLERIQQLRRRVYAWRGRENGTPGVETATELWLEQLTDQARRTREGQEEGVPAILDEIAESLTANIHSSRPRSLDSVVELQGRLMGHAERARNTADQLAERAANQKDPAARAKLLAAAARHRGHATEYADLAAAASRTQARMQADSAYDARSVVEGIVRDMRKVGAEHYDVYLPLQDPVTFARVVEWMTRETAPLEQMPGGDFLRREILDQLHSASELVLRQSPRQAGLDLKTTAQMRRIVFDGIRDGRYAEYAEAFFKAGGREGWPRGPDGRAWEVDHVFELWQGGADDLHNYLPVDARLHKLKSEILSRFRAEFRDPNRVEGEQIDAHQGVTGGP